MKLPNILSGSLASPATGPVQPAKSRLHREVTERLAERQGALPVWVRPPKGGPEFYSGFSRSKLYCLADERKIRSVSIREPGQQKGTRLFHLQSIFEFIEKCEAAANE